MDQLPSDLLALFVQAIAPDDLENFALTSHAMYEHSLRRLARHRQLKKKFTNVTIAEGAQFNHPALLLLEIHYEPEIAQYIKYLSIAIQDPLSIDLESYPAEVIKSIQALHEIGSEISPRVGAASFSLLSKLQLKRLRFNTPLWKILSTCYPNIGRVESFHPDTDTLSDCNEALQWTAESIASMRVGGEITVPVSAPVLHLTDANIDAESLRMIECVRDFRYNASPDCFWDVATMVSCLPQTLERLSLTITTGPVTKFESLKHFERLRIFEGHLEMMALERGIATILPTSIEQLTLINGDGCLPMKHEALLRLDGIEELTNCQLLILVAARLDSETDAMFSGEVQRMDWFLPEHVKFWQDDPPLFSP